MGCGYVCFFIICIITYISFSCYEPFNIYLCRNFCICYFIEKVITWSRLSAYYIVKSLCPLVSQ
nr:MAG TPA: hypothetical protein [Caudoviricetes sp.]